MDWVMCVEASRLRSSRSSAKNFFLVDKNLKQKRIKCLKCPPLLQQVGGNEEGAKAKGHPLRSIDELQGHEMAHFYTWNTNYIP